MSNRTLRHVPSAVEENFYSTRQNIGRYGLSATVSLVVSCSGYPAAYANNVSFSPTVPVVHSFVHNVVAPTSTHTPTQTHVHTSQTNNLQTTALAIHSAISSGDTNSQTSTSAHVHVNSHTVAPNTATSASKFAHTNSAISGNANSLVSNLNLSSGKSDLSASLLGNFQSLTIDVGGKADVVKMSSKLTDAEFIAAEQVYNSGASAGHQTLALSNAGAASGGTVQLNSALLSSLDSAVGGTVTALTIPKHVTIDDSLSSLSLSGVLTNKGALVAQSTAGNPESISASSIINTGTIHGNSDLTINSRSIDNTGGTISAARTINIANAGGLDIKGGNILSKTLNLDAGSSTLNVNGSNITGVVNDTAGDAHINATSKNFD